MFTNFEKIIPFTSQHTHNLWYSQLICDSFYEDVTDIHIYIDINVKID